VLVGVKDDAQINLVHRRISTLDVHLSLKVFRRFGQVRVLDGIQRTLSQSMTSAFEVTVLSIPSKFGGIFGPVTLFFMIYFLSRKRIAQTLKTVRIEAKAQGNLSFATLSSAS
jgi:hypothetical protein